MNNTDISPANPTIKIQKPRLLSALEDITAAYALVEVDDGWRHRAIKSDSQVAFDDLVQADPLGNANGYGRTARSSVLLLNAARLLSLPLARCRRNRRDIEHNAARTAM
jgi:hypothetical protein